MRSVLAALLLLWAGFASAGSSTVGSTQIFYSQQAPVATNSGQFETENVLLCFIPDVQHMSAGKVWTPDQRGLTCSMANPVNILAPGVMANCVGAFCDQSVYCKNNWRDTTARYLYNMAYEMTGQYEKIDYTGISGNDDTRSFQKNPLDHPKCSIIIGLGDMADQAGDPVTDPQSAEFGNPGYFADNQQGSLATANAYCDSLPEQTKREWAVTENFWRIIDASGIPYLPLKGNHDTRSCYRVLMNRLSFTAEPFYFGRETTDEQSWAILAPTAAGKPFCIVGINDGFIDSLGTGDGTTAADKTFFTNTIGCGGGFPTIVVQHGLVTGVGDLTGPMRTTVNTAMKDLNNSEVFLVVGGHYSQTTSTKELVAAAAVRCAGACAFAHYRMYSNWQDMNHHKEALPPYGMVPQDSAGGAYTVVLINPKRSSLMAWDWDTYFHTVGFPSALSGVVGSSLNSTFDFHTRYP